MKRLTEYTIPETGFSVVSEEKYKRILMEEKPSVEKVYNRLKKIEDILGDEYDLDRLRELARADREGRCVVLPCQFGERAYKIYRKWESHFGCDHCLDGYGMGRVCDYYDSDNNNCTNMKGKYDGFEIVSRHFSAEMIPEIGKTVFLTREAAEKAVEEMEENRNG